MLLSVRLVPVLLPLAARRGESGIGTTLRLPTPSRLVTTWGAIRAMRALRSRYCSHPPWFGIARAIKKNAGAQGAAVDCCSECPFVG